VPWCEPCSKFYNPNSLPPTGECPSCGRALDRPEALATAVEAAKERVKVPWHFWLLLSAICAYLGWRLIQGVDALLGWVT
jgi:hypothetical protein